MHFDPSDPYYPRSSLIHRLDPRVKVITTLATVIAISLIPDGRWDAYAGAALLIISASVLSKLGPTFTLRRSYLALPFVLAAVILLFTVPGPTLYRLPLLGWEITRTGWSRFLSILLRSVLAVQVGTLMIATTRFPDLLWGLGALRFPGLLVSTVAFMYRYLFVLGDEAVRMLRARAARSASHAGSRPPLQWRGRVAGNMVGSLFLRALERSERVYAAMLARGYDGSMRSVQAFQMKPGDWAAIALSVLVLTTLSYAIYRTG
jgi:cobalt/nickel transport system permease protein